MFLPSKEKPFYYCLKVMQHMRFYPFAKDLNDLEKYRKVALSIRILTCFPLFECLLHLVMSIKNKVPIDYMADHVILISSLNTLVICNMFQICNKECSKLFFDLHEITDFGVPPKMAYTVKRIQFYSKICLWYCFFGTMLYVLESVFIESVPCRESNKIKGVHEICGSVTMIWWPYDEIHPIALILINLIEAICIVYYMPPSAIIILIVCEATQIIILKIYHLKHLLKETFTIEGEGLRRQHLSFCIKYHQEILRVAKSLSIINKKVLGHSFICGALIGCSLFQTIRHKSLGSFMQLVGYICAILICCIAGQNLEDETIGIRNALYESKWYIDPKLAKDAQLILLRCETSSRLKTLPLGALNNELFVTILKAAYSYWTLMIRTSNLTKKEN